MTQIVNALSDISAQYDALFVDLWGCVHNGVRAFDAANKALIEYRAGGGIVVLVTNSPRPRAQVEQQLADFGVARDNTGPKPTKFSQGGIKPILVVGGHDHACVAHRKPFGKCVDDCRIVDFHDRLQNRLKNSGTWRFPLFPVRIFPCDGLILIPSKTSGLMAL